MRSWLSVRYDRAAFPDAFVDRMKKNRSRQKDRQELERHGELISFVFFELDGGLTLERADGEPYELSIVLVYSPGNDPEEFADAADKVAQEVKEACEGRLSDKKAIIFKSCFAISEDDIPLAVHGHSPNGASSTTLKADDGQPGPIDCSSRTYPVVAAPERGAFPSVHRWCMSFRLLE